MERKLKETNVQGKSIIVGLGKTGLSVAKYMVANGLDFKILDTRSQPPMLNYFRTHFPDVEVETGKLDLSSLLGAKELIISPGLSLKTPEIQSAKSYGIPIRGDVDIFSQVVDAPIIGVTGSNGKSTVVAMLREILKKAGKRFGLGGNLDGAEAKPALDLLQGEAKELYVLELSSFQLETTTSLQAEVAVILNLSEDHMDRYESIDEYHKAKLRIFNGCRQLVINRDDVYSYPTEDFGVPVRDFGFDRPGRNGLGLFEEDGEQFLCYQLEKIIAVNELKVFGQHNISNVLAAIALALAVDIDIDKIRSGIKEFSGLPHRCQWVCDISGVSFYNDSKGTNVGATMAAIEGLGQRNKGHVVLIAGGVAKGADFSLLVPTLKRWVKELVLIGKDAEDIASNFYQDISINFAKDMGDAVSIAKNKASPGDAVLLSPACASFDMFRDFQHRGQKFTEVVENLL